MAAAALPGLNAEGLYSGSSVPNSGPQNPGLQGASLDQGPSIHPQHHMSARPIYYVPAPPPPPFLQYQWPMPFYNPFTGFPGMGYGMAMPPFPPPPYMEAPAYVLPHPHIQPVDYRRLLQPPVHGPCAPYQNTNHSQRIHQPHTVPGRQTVNSAVQTEPTQRGTVGYSIESPPVRSDSGHGESDSPSSSSTSSQKQGSAKIDNYILTSSNAKDLPDNRNGTNCTVKHGFNIPTKTVGLRIRGTIETQTCRKDNATKENVPGVKKAHCNVWSVSSPDSMVPVCSSSQQEDEVVKERRVSFPDILMSWGGGTPQELMQKMADQVLPSIDTEVEPEKQVDQSRTERKNEESLEGDGYDSPDVSNVLSPEDSETLLKILNLPVALHEYLTESRRESEPVELVGSSRRSLTYSEEKLHSLNKSPQLLDDEQETCTETNPHEDTTELIPDQVHLNGCPTKRKMNESVWSVESLAPFIPTKEGQLQKSVFEPEVIIEITEEPETGRLLPQNDNLSVKSSKERRQSCRFSSDSIPMSDSWLIFRTPPEKRSPPQKPDTSETDASKMSSKQIQPTLPVEKNSLISLTRLPDKNMSSIPTEGDIDENRSSEPEANQSPNQESLIIDEHQEENSCSPAQEETLLNSEAGEKISPTGQLILQNGAGVEDEASGKEAIKPRNEQLCAPMSGQGVPEVSPLKENLVDCGVQCTELQCLCHDSMTSMGPGRRAFYLDTRKANGDKAEGFYKSGHMQKNQKRYNQKRNRGQDNPSGYQEGNSGYYGKPGKSRGGHGRNPRC